MSIQNPEEVPTTLIADAILGILQQQPFSSVREFAKLACIPRTTIHQHLARVLGGVVKHLHWVPHGLTLVQKATRVTLAKQLLRVLRSIKHQTWEFIVTLDE
jgi:hypothetical protein